MNAELDATENALLTEARELADKGSPLTAEHWDALDDADERPDDYVHCTDTDDYRLTTDGSAWYCDACDDYHSDEEESSEVTARTSWLARRNGIGTVENWCEDAISRDAFRCEWTGDYYAHAHFQSVEVDGDTVCLEANDHDVYYWESDGEYHRDPEPMDEIPGYHDEDRDWDVPEGEGLTIGVELETYCPDALEAYNARPDGIIGERDGSLCSRHGVEFIGAPLLLSDYRAGCDWDKFLSRLRSMGATSWDAPDSEYGMHVSVGRAEMSREQQLAFVLLVNRNKAFSEAIAGRAENRWAYYDKTDPDAAHQAVTTVFGGDKYSATHVDRQRIEVRIFRGTLSWEGFAKNVQYVHAAATFAKECLLDDLSIAAFTAWLKGHREEYPELVAFIEKKGLDKA